MFSSLLSFPSPLPNIIITFSQTHLPHLYRFSNIYYRYHKCLLLSFSSSLPSPFLFMLAFVLRCGGLLPANMEGISGSLHPATSLPSPFNFDSEQPSCIISWAVVDKDLPFALDPLPHGQGEAFSVYWIWSTWGYEWKYTTFWTTWNFNDNFFPFHSILFHSRPFHSILLLYKAFSYIPLNDVEMLLEHICMWENLSTPSISRIFFFLPQLKLTEVC